MGGTGRTRDPQLVDSLWRSFALSHVHLRRSFAQFSPISANATEPDLTMTVPIVPITILEPDWEKPPPRYPALVPLLGRRGGYGFNGSFFDHAELDAHGEIVVCFEQERHTGRKGLSFDRLSGGEKAALFVELAIVRARSLQTSGVAVLVIDSWPTVTGSWGPPLGTLLAQLTHSVQVLVTTELRDVNFDTTGWARIHLPVT
jgi:hypothetical protein